MTHEHGANAMLRKRNSSFQISPSFQQCLGSAVSFHAEGIIEASKMMKYQFIVFQKTKTREMEKISSNSYLPSTLAFKFP